MAKRKVQSLPAGTTAILWKKRSYAVGDEVPDDFPDEKLSAPAAEASEGGESAEGNTEGTGAADTGSEGGKKKGSKTKK